MAKHLFAVVGGFVLWSVLWLIYNTVLRKLAFLPSDTTMRVESVSPLFILLVGSIAISIIAGWVAAAIEGRGTGSPIIVLAVLLFATGIFFETQNWRLLPVWYHLVFLALVVPAVMLGARLRGR